tara:strand:+ start:2431 stop:2955 length:525 start_codon:yes stop_codon:yes gene_type:complete
MSRVYATAEVDAKRFKRLMIELSGVKDPKRQQAILGKAGQAADLILRDATIRGYQAAGTRLKDRPTNKRASGAFLKGITTKGSYANKAIKRRGGSLDFVSWINFKKPTNRMVHLFETGFTPGYGTTRIAGWFSRRRALKRNQDEMQRVFMRSMRVLLDIGRKKDPTVSELRKGG